MPRKPASLPEDLAYLEPAARALRKLPPEELNEDADLEPVERVLRKRFGGQNIAKADRLLASDLQKLERWLKGRENDRSAQVYHFLYGCLFMISFQGMECIEEPSPPPPPGVIRANVPSGLRVTRCGGEPEIKHRGLTFAAAPADPAFLENAKEALIDKGNLVPEYELHSSTVA